MILHTTKEALLYTSIHLNTFTSTLNRVEEYDHNYFHRRISIVSQEPVLFARSIMENILYGLAYRNPEEYTNFHVIKSLLNGKIAECSLKKRYTCV